MTENNKIVAYTSEEQFKTAMKKAIDLNQHIKKDTAELKEIKPRLIGYMSENDVRVMEDGSYKASWQTANSSKLDEDGVIKLIEKKMRQARKPEKKELLGSAIVTVKQINEDVLEQLMFDGVISAKELEPYTSTSVTNKIRLDFKK